MRKKIILLLMLSLICFSVRAKGSSTEGKGVENKVAENKATGNKELTILQEKIKHQEKEVEKLNKKVKDADKKLKESKEQDKETVSKELKDAKDAYAKASEDLKKLNEELAKLKAKETNRIYKLAVENLDSATVDSLYSQVCVKDPSKLLEVEANKLDSASVDSLYRMKCARVGDSSYSFIETVIVGISAFLLGLICSIVPLLIRHKKTNGKKSNTPKPKITLERETCDRNFKFTYFKIKGSK